MPTEIDSTFPEVLGIGEVLWDMLPDGKQLGGAPANFAYHVHALGLSAAPISAVGRDRLGRELLKRLESRGVDTRYIARLETRPTSTVDVELEDGKPTYDIHTGVAWDHLPLTGEVMTAASKARAICFGTLAQRSPVSRETIRRLLDEAPEECLKVFDVNLRQDFYDADVVSEGLQRAHVLKLNDEEVIEVARLLGLPEDEDGFGERLLEEHGLKLLVVTRGKRGSLLRTAEEKDEHPGAKAEVVSTVGAGDSFTAATVAGWLRGRPLAKIHDHAARLAAFVCTQQGAMPDLPEDLLSE